jgi:outer membrane lipoprotein-sorting protein
MARLAELLELIYLARDRWTTVEATMTDWTHVLRSQEAYERYLVRTGRVTGLAVSVAPPRDYPAEVEYSSRVWLGADGRFRQERVGGHDDMTLVNDGEKVWISTRQSGVIEHESHAMTPSGGELFDPAGLIPALDLEPGARAVVAGRAAHLVGARPRRTHEPPGDLVPAGCDEVRLAIDAERGVVLRIESLARGQPVRLIEVAQIVFDAPIDDERFRFELPPGEQPRTAAEAYPTENVTLEQAAREASFTVWIPGRLPPRWRAHVLFRPETERPRLPEVVTILFSDTESLHFFGMEQAGERLLAWRTGDERVVERGGVELRVIGGDRLPGPPLEVHLERGETHLRIYSDNLDEAALIELAETLTPAPTQQPPVSDRGSAD